MEEVAAAQAAAAPVLPPAAAPTALQARQETERWPTCGQPASRMSWAHSYTETNAPGTTHRGYWVLIRDPYGYRGGRCYIYRADNRLLVSEVQWTFPCKSPSLQWFIIPGCVLFMLVVFVGVIKCIGYCCYSGASDSAEGEAGGKEGDDGSSISHDDSDESVWSFLCCPCVGALK